VGCAPPQDDFQLRERRRSKLCRERKFAGFGEVGKVVELYLGGKRIPCVDEFKVLGNVIGVSGSSARDVQIKTARGSGRIHALRKTWWTKMELVTRREIYCQAVLGSVLSGSEVWEDTSEIRGTLKKFEISALKMITSRFRDKIEKEGGKILSRMQLQELLGVDSILDVWVRRRSAWVERKLAGNCKPVKKELRKYRASSDVEDTAWWSHI
jgi:hypothetical protein